MVNKVNRKKKFIIPTSPHIHVPSKQRNRGMKKNWQPKKDESEVTNETLSLQSNNYENLY